MAIKVKHEGSVASRMAAAAQGGAAKRAMEAAALVKPTQIQTLAPAHASAPSPGGAHAQLISAPGGGAHAPLIGGGGGIGAHARMGGGGIGRAGSAGSRVSTGAGGGDLDYKVTGTSIFDRPDDESQWDPTGGGRWVRKWLPGEKEAEARGRMMDAEFSARQRAEFASINNALEDARRSGRYTPEEMKELERQADEKRLGIKPLPTPREKDAQKSFEERLVNVGGVQGYINAKGDFQAIEKDDGFANFLKVYPKLAEYTEDETITDPATGQTKTEPVTKTRSAAEIAQLVTQARESWKQARNPSAVQQRGDPLEMTPEEEADVRAMLESGQLTPLEEELLSEGELFSQQLKDFRGELEQRHAAPAQKPGTVSVVPAGTPANPVSPSASAKPAPAKPAESPELKRRKSKWSAFKN